VFNFFVHWWKIKLQSFKHEHRSERNQPNGCILCWAVCRFTVFSKLKYFITLWLFVLMWGPFTKFVDSAYYSKSEFCGGAVTVSFSKYLPWQVMHFLQRPTHFSKTCCRQLITSKFLASELPFHGWQSPEIKWGEIWIGESRSMEPH
jgi:hypothetical protein